MKKRIIPSILLKGGTQVTISQGFSPWRSVGALAQNLRLHVHRAADELLIINLDNAGAKNFLLPERILRLVRQEVDIPIAYAGGIRTKRDASVCIHSGFDKAYVTATFLDHPENLREIADVVGMQSLGLILPYKRTTVDYSAYIWDYLTRSRTSYCLRQAVRDGILHGAGEIVLYDVVRDGSLAGFDPMIYKDLEELNPSVPILIAGGSGDPAHIAQALKCDWIQGVIAGSIFALTQETPSTIRHYCEDKGLSMRRYSGFSS